MMGIGGMTIGKDKVNSFGKMEINMKVLGTTIKKMEKESIIDQTGMFTLVNGKMINLLYHIFLWAEP